MEYPKGSEWRKWDLHIHTPASFYWNGSKSLLVMSNAEKKEEIKTFIKAINESDASVFCIMDYWTFDWYIELRKYLEVNTDELKKTILPGMELRIECPVDYRLNIHCILSDKLTLQELNDFKSELIIRSIDKKLSNDSLQQFAKSLDDSKAQKHGFSSPKSLSDDKLLQLGSQTAEITKESLRNAFKQIPQDTGFIILPYDTSDGLLKLNWEEHPHDDNYFMQSAHIFETREQKNIDLISGIRTSENEKFFENFFKTLGGKAKPCISGSDAHKYSDYAKFPSNKITWIKSNPTFEGLRQILYEPETRVKIQSDKPDYKREYLTIDKVRFISKDGKFQENSIAINNNLNSIIGGKSSGKSLLLYYIAKTISPNLVYEIEKQYSNSNKSFGYTFDELDFEVTWSDGFTQILSNPQDSNRTISYVPQFYINEIAENTKDRKALNKLISDILKEESNFYTSISEKTHQLQELIENQSLELSKYFNLIEKIKEKDSETKEIGDKDAIIKNKEKLTKELEDLRKESNFSEEDEKNYKDLFVVKEHYTYSISHFEHIITTLKGLKTKLEEYSKSDIENLLSQEFASLLNENKESEIAELMSILKDNLSLTISNTLKSFLDFAFKSRNSHFTDEKKSFEKELGIVLSQLKPYDEKLANKEKFEKIQKELNEENEKLRLIQSKQDAKEQLVSSIGEIKIIDTYKEIFDNYNSRVKIIEDYKNIGEDLELTSYVSFNTIKFDNNFVSKVSKKSALQNQFSEEIFEGNLFRYDPIKHIENIKTILDKVLTGKIQLNQGTSIRDLVHGLVSDCFEVEYDLVQKGDKLLKMSPGKRGLVLFQLYLKLSNSTNPILIDQPEDNLDNRTVYTQLNDFIKRRKIHRQILMVSHNANLVVSTDSENVIVANQHGQNIESQKRKYDFEYVSGALEDSFKDDKEIGILFQKGIREHVCEILEGGEEAFQNREKKYGLSQH